MPNHWGAALTVAAVTSCLRSCENGNRETWADFLSEMLEGDPHAHAVLKKCYSSIANNDWEILPADCESEREKKNAQLVADDVARVIKAIPHWRANVFQLLWGHLTGLNASEIIWGYDGSEWYVRRLHSIPSRRCHLDDDFRPYVGDGWSSQPDVYFDDMPGKFLVYQPVVTGDVPTREGLGRIIAYWLAFKRWAVRDYVSYTERYGKPTPVVTHSTGLPEGERKADEDDVRLANSIVENIGRGTQPGASIPDTLKIDFADAGKGSGSGNGADRTVHNALIALCNAEISKAVLGGTLTTEVGSSGGNRALGERQGDDQDAIFEAIARQIDDVITAGLVDWIVRLNYGDVAADKYAPRYHTKIESEEDLESAANVLETLVGIGLEVRKAEVYERFGWGMPTKGDDVLTGAVAPSSPPPSEPEPEPEPEPDTEPDTDAPDDEGDEE